jgi:hypothetical protein
VLEKLDARAGHYGEVSRKVREFAEVGYKETFCGDGQNRVAAGK